MIFKLQNPHPKEGFMKKVTLGSGLPRKVPVLSIHSAPFCSDVLDNKSYGHPIYGIFAVLKCLW